MDWTNQSQEIQKPESACTQHLQECKNEILLRWAQINDIMNKEEIPENLVVPIQIKADKQPIVDCCWKTIRHETLLRPFFEYNGNWNVYLRPDFYLDNLKDSSLESYKESILQMFQEAVSFAKKNNWNVTINFWKVEFDDPEYYSLLLHMCEYCCVSPSQITIEILEDIRVWEIEKEVWLERIKQMKKDWFYIAVDDFLSKILKENKTEENEKTVDSNEYSRELSGIYNMNPEIIEAIDTIKIDRWFVIKMFEKHNTQITDIEMRFIGLFRTLLTSPLLRKKTIILEWMYWNRIIEALDYLKKSFPENKFCVQCNATWKPSESGMTEKQEKDICCYFPNK